MPLTDIAVRSAKPKDGKQAKKFDGGGLYLLVRPSGSKLWQMTYRFGGKTKTLSFGIYPEVTLADARAKRDEAKSVLRQNLDPQVKKKLDRIQTVFAQTNTFGALVGDYIARLADEGKSEATMDKNRWLLQDLANPLHGRPASDIKPIEILSVLETIERSGRRETAHRLRGTIGSVFRFGIAKLRCDNDPTFALRGALMAVQTTSHPAITDEKAFGRLLLAIDDYDGWPTLTAALKVQAICWQRPGETRTMEWSELDLKARKWSIPAEKTKMRRPHDVPLSDHAIEVITDIQRFSGAGRLVFPSIRSGDKPLSENAMNAALRRMGVTKTEHCAHGFRSSASTILNSRGVNGDWIETQLAHLDENEVRRAYNRAKYWPERVTMMEDWAKLCDGFKALR